MKTLLSYYQEAKEELKTQLEAAQTPEQTVKIIQDEVSHLTDLSGDYMKELTPPQARLATTLLKLLSQYTSILLLAKLQAPITNVSATVNKTTELSLPSLSIATTLADYRQKALEKLQQNREVFSSFVTGGIAGTLAGGYAWGFVGAILGGVIGRIVSQNLLFESTNTTAQIEPVQQPSKVVVDTERLLNYLYQALQAIDITVAAYGETTEKLSPQGLENYLELLEYLQDLMADTLDEQNQLPMTVRRRIGQVATILRHYGIETRIYQPSETQDLEFYFEPSLDPQITDYITLKHAFVKNNQLLLPGYVIEPTSSPVGAES